MILQDLCVRPATSSKSFFSCMCASIVFLSLSCLEQTCLPVGFHTKVTLLNCSTMLCSGPTHFPEQSTLVGAWYCPMDFFAVQFKCSKWRSPLMFIPGFPVVFIHRDHSSCAFCRCDGQWYCTRSVSASIQ